MSLIELLYSYALDRERQTITAEKERQLTTLRAQENDLHALQLNLSEVKSQLRDKSALEKRIGEMKQEVTDVSAHLKVSRYFTGDLATF